MVCAVLFATVLSLQGEIDAAAAKAGVALGTVSQVFNGIPVGDLYKRKVLEAAKQLG